MIRDKKKKYHKKINKTLTSLISHVETIKGDFDLGKIFISIGRYLKPINIGVIVGIVDSDKKNLIIRYINLPNSSLNNEVQKLINRSLQIKKLKNYQEVLRKNRTLFLPDRAKELCRKLPEIKTCLNTNASYNSLIISLKIRGETIGLIEFLGEQIDKNYLNDFKKFTRSLIRNIANIVLFQEVKNSEEKYRQLVNNATDAVVIINNEGYITFSNQALFRISGYSEEELSKLPRRPTVHFRSRYL